MNREFCCSCSVCWCSQGAAATMGVTAAAGDVSGDVSFMVFGDPEEIQAYRDVIAAYENENSDVDVKMIEASDRDDLIARLSTSFAAGTPPDLFLLNYRFYAQFAARDVLEPIEDRGRLGRLPAGGLLRGGDERVPLQRHADVPPQNISSLVVYYNKNPSKRQASPSPRKAGSGTTWSRRRRS